MNPVRHDLACIRFDTNDPRKCNCGLQEVIDEAVRFERARCAQIAKDHANQDGHDSDCQGDEDCNEVIERKIKKEPV